MKYLKLLFFIFISSCSEAQSKLPSRAECIVRVDFVDEQILGHELEEIYPAVSAAIRQSNRKGFSVKPPSLAIPSDNRKVIYLQYKEKCSERFRLTTELFSSYVKKSVNSLPKYEISRDRISPSSSTIDVQGIYWSD